MGMHLTPNAYLYVKTTKFEGCTDKYHGRHFHKRLILVGYFGNNAVMSAFKMVYVCVGKLGNHGHLAYIACMKGRRLFGREAVSLQFFLTVSVSYRQGGMRCPALEV